MTDIKGIIPGKSNLQKINNPKIDIKGEMNKKNNRTKK